MSAARDFLFTAGDKLKHAREEKAEAMKEVAEAVIKARDAGMSVTSISNILGVTRQTVYDILSRKSKK